MLKQNIPLMFDNVAILDNYLLRTGKYRNEKFSTVFNNDRSYSEYMCVMDYKDDSLSLFKQYCIDNAKKLFENIIELNYICKPNLCIMVSSISCLSGRNKYCPPHEAVIKHIVNYEKVFLWKMRNIVAEEQEIYKPLYDLWDNLYQEFYPGESLGDMISFTYKQEVDRLSKLYPEIKDYIDNLSEEEEIDIEEVSKTLILPTEIARAITEEIIDELKFEDIATPKETKNNINIIKELTNESSKEVTTEVIKNYDCMRGIVKELTVYDKLNNKGYDVRDKQKAASIIIKIDELRVKIFGKLDGILYENNKPVAVVEIKNRKRRYAKIPDADLDQLAFYIELTGYHRAILVECIDGELFIHEFTRNDLLLRYVNIIRTEDFVGSLSKINFLVKNSHSEYAIKFAREYLCNTIYNE
jgi:hypothetical protein